MKPTSIISLFLTCFMVPSRSAAPAGYRRTCSTIRLLNVVPYPDNDTFAGWDKGFELIPAGHLATKHINQNPDVLPGYQLEVIDVLTEACGRSTSYEGLVEVYRKLAPPHNKCVFGVVGLYCSTMTNTIAPIVDHPNFGHVVLAASTSPRHRNTANLPHTFHTIASSSVFNEAIIALMDEFKWKKINVVHDSLGFYFTSTTDDFVKLIKSSNDKKIASKIPIQPHQSSISDTLDIINDEEARIGYFSITEGEAAALFCEAYKRRFLWPGYVYTLHERSLPQILSTPVNCSQEEIVHALEGVFLLQYRLLDTQSIDLVSGISYEQYHAEYVEELNNFALRTKMTLTDNVYANSLYDQVWALALTVNKSLGNIAFFNSSSATTDVEEMLRTREFLANKLKEIEFYGASGFIKFGPRQEVRTSVDIYQVRNGVQVLVGFYDSYNQSIDLFRSLHKDLVPGDSFELYYKLVPAWVGILVAFGDLVLFVLILFITIYFILRKNLPEIKSSSLPLSLVMLMGCYSLCISTMLYTIIRVVPSIIKPSTFAILCNLDLWFFLNGINIIFVTLAVRLLRIFHVFRSYRSTGKYWSDKYLVLYITLICLIMVFFLAVWTMVDPLHRVQERMYVPSGTPPHYLVRNHCSSEDIGIWIALSLCLIGLVMLSVIFLAVQTRHIKRKHFKDTKKVNIFIFSVCVLCAIFLPMWLILFSVGVDTGSYVSKCIVKLSGAALCPILLFLPKIIPSLCSKWKAKVVEPRGSKMELTKSSSITKDSSVASASP